VGESVLSKAFGPSTPTSGSAQLLPAGGGGVNPIDRVPAAGIVAEP